MTLAKAVEDFLAVKRTECKPKTVTAYTADLNRFLAWAAGEGLAETGDLRPSDLDRFRNHVLAAKKTTAKRKADRGRRRGTAKALSPRSRNRILDTMRIFLTAARRLDRLPWVDADAISDRLRGVREELGAPDFLRAPDVREVLKAALRHDVETFALTREEHDGLREPGTTLRYDPVAPVVLAQVLGGFRPGELRALEWTEVDVPGAVIRLSASKTKTKRDRTIGLAETPSLLALLKGMKLRSGGARYVFGGAKPMTADAMKAARRRLISKYGAPKAFTWLALRRSCGSCLTCAAAIYGAASAFLSAKRLGHSVTIAERHYVGAVLDIPARAKTLEAALGIEGLAAAGVTEEAAVKSREA